MGMRSSLQAHDLEVGVLGGLGDADVVVEALAHALYAVGAYKDGNKQALLGPSAPAWIGARGRGAG